MYWGLLLALFATGCVERALSVPEGRGGPAGPVDAGGGPVDAGGGAVDLATPRKPIGTPCLDGRECQSGECGAGVCACSRTVCGDACVDLDSDGDNCGACGHGCAGDGCSAGLCRAVTLIDDQERPYALAANESDVYLRNYSQQILRVPARGGTMSSFASSTGTAGPHGITLDSSYVYYVDYEGGNVAKVPLAGGKPITLATDQHWPTAIAVDSQQVYWVNAYDETVIRLPLGSGTGAAIVTGRSNTDSLCTIASDGVYVYWMFNGGYLMRAPVNGGTAMKVFPEYLNQSTFALNGDDIYFADGAGSISAVATTGGASNGLTPADRLPAFIATDGKDIYYTTTDEFDGQLRRVPVAGGTPTVLAAKQRVPGAIALNSTYIFWVEEGGSVQGRLHRMAK